MLNYYSMVTQLCFHWASVPSTPLLCCLAIIKCLILVKPGCCWPAVWLCWPWETLGNSQLSSTDWWTAGASWGWHCGWDEPKPQGGKISFLAVCVCVSDHVDLGKLSSAKYFWKCYILKSFYSFWSLWPTL